MIFSQHHSGSLASHNPMNEIVYPPGAWPDSRPWDGPVAHSWGSWGCLVNPFGEGQEGMYRVGKFSEGENLETGEPRPDDTVPRHWRAT